MTLTILADDLTGSCDTGTLFAVPAPVPVTLWPGVPPRAEVRVVDTETRSASDAEAVARVSACAAAVGPARWFKKVDSTLRGHVAAEVDVLARAVGAPGVLLCPAFPAQGRTVADRLLLVDGRPVADTPIGRDPDFPRPGTSSVIDLLRPRLGWALGWIPLPQVREERHDLAARLDRLAGMVVVADAETDADLAALVEAALMTDHPPLLAGSAGMAEALARRLGLLPPPLALPRLERWLVLAGSRHPATRAQVLAARAAGLAVVAPDEAPQPDRLAVARGLAREAVRRLDAERFDAVAVTGGHTAIALWEALDAERLDLAGAPAPGLAFGLLHAPGRPGLPVLTKAGGFGGPELFVGLGRGAAP